MGELLPLHTGFLSPQPLLALVHVSLGQATAELSVLAACALWLQRLREGLAALWHLTGSRILAQDTELLQEITQLLWNNAETPVRTQCQRL